MSSFTPRLSLKRNDGTDPFKRSDFTDNWNKLDAAPGVHVCTSTTRPSTWGVAQAGRSILETDTYRTLYWDGTQWIEPRSAVGSATFSSTVAATLNSGTIGTYALGTLTVLRPAMVCVTMHFRVSCKPYLYTRAQVDVVIDDVIRTKGNTGTVSWADTQASATQYDDKVITTVGEWVLMPGNHTIKGRVQNINVGTGGQLNVGYITSFSLVTTGAFGASTYI